VSGFDVHHNQVFGGKSFAGIACWLTSSGCHDGSFRSNSVSYAAFSGIMVGGGDHLSIAGNTASYNGESGFKTYQGSPQQNAYVSVIDNTSKYNFYDGFDISSNANHTSSFVAVSFASGNVSINNGQTGFTGDGQYWTFTGNVSIGNGTYGILADFCESTISENTSYGNNTSATSAHQLVVSGNVACGDNVVSGNVTNTRGNLGYGLYANGMPASTIIKNHEVTGTNIINFANTNYGNSYQSTTIAVSGRVIASNKIALRTLRMRPRPLSH
jgi:hypothetical protein